MLNLLRNAAEANVGFETPKLAVTARMVREERVRIEVADNRPEVETGLEAQIFTPFFSTKSQGSGIGLALVRQLVHGNGGTVRYARRREGGACFVLSF